MSATLELDALSAGYDRAPVVRDLTLSVAPGEVVALIGANGAGKTTALRAISGLVKAMGGLVRRTAPTLTASRHGAGPRGIVHVPQGRGIFYGLTVGEHFRLDGVREGPELDAAFAHFPALRDLRDRRAGLLSGGEQQMLAIARALSRRPRLLLLDELSLGLAPVIVERLLPVVREFASTQGPPCCWSTNTSTWRLRSPIVATCSRTASWWRATAPSGARGQRAIDRELSRREPRLRLRGGARAAECAGILRAGGGGRRSG